MYPDLKIIVDWHNLNYTILNLKFHNLNHPLVRFLKAYERVLSRRYADLNFTVTEAMRSFLIRDFKLDPRKIITVYDRPSEKFSPLKNAGELKSILDSSNELFGEYDGEKDKILITSTSFTADEDFTILVEALKKLDSILVEKKQDSKVLMIVTGKGPLKKDFIKAISDYNWEQVIIKDIWLSDDDYPRILKVADLGISLHYSSSGLDLPMKIVDLFGSGIPVISMGYPVISELVRKGKNGLVLDDNRCGDEMAEKIYDTLYEDRNLFRQLRTGAIEESKRRWNDEWDGKLGERFRLAE
ncbi:DEKNAAC100604 [Brettanomyces naardenensis]|uniref:Chitobiosyldiphosphodolichol beta-mannosyltransferase n=1 Tax=Brettanomyces naardenensis TaxID=13370 RepID=A0A448YG53_BRENA|nr:DEKNAAC100604 [Brettanomyces naardenensis]